MASVVEEAGAVETERGGWAAGGTAVDEEEKEGMADSAAVGEKKEREKHNINIKRHLQEFIA